METQVTINKEAFEEILRRLQWLKALEDAGVESWSGYDEAYLYYKGVSDA